jgi:hypothetical protein
VRVPQLAGDEDLFSWHSAVLNSLPDLTLVTVNQSGVDMAIPVLQSERDRRADLSWLGLPGG